MEVNYREPVSRWYHTKEVVKPAFSGAEQTLLTRRSEYFGLTTVQCTLTQYFPELREQGTRAELLHRKKGTHFVLFNAIAGFTPLCCAVPPRITFEVAASHIILTVIVPTEIFLH